MRYVTTLNDKIDHNKIGAIGNSGATAAIVVMVALDAQNMNICDAI